MHDLYLQWLSVRGNWGACKLTISAGKRNIKDTIELYEFLTPAALAKEVGEDLAKDLMQRHADAEKKLPADRKGQFIRKKLSLITALVNLIVTYSTKHVCL